MHGSQHKRGPWSKEEDGLLLHLVGTFGAKNWGQIERAFGGRRLAKQCRERYQQNLRPDLNRSPIGQDEGRRINELVAQHGQTWAHICRLLDNNRADGFVKNWWYGQQNHLRKEEEKRQGDHHHHYHHNTGTTTTTAPVPAPILIPTSSIPALPPTPTTPTTTSLHHRLDALFHPQPQPQPFTHSSFSFSFSSSSSQPAHHLPVGAARSNSMPDSTLLATTPPCSLSPVSSSEGWCRRSAPASPMAMAMATTAAGQTLTLPLPPVQFLIAEVDALWGTPPPMPPTPPPPREREYEREWA